jgi:hypothetical protein
MRVRAFVALLVAALAAGGVACGEGEESSASGQTLNLTVRVEDGKGKVAKATLACDDGGAGHGSGFLSSSADDHCRDALGLQRLLTTQPPKDQVCTQLYGGPQTAHIAGTLAGQTVARDLARTNGCEIADWQKAEPLLAPSGIRAGAAGP